MRKDGEAGLFKSMSGGVGSGEDPSMMFNKLCILSVDLVMSVQRQY